MNSFEFIERVPSFRSTVRDLMEHGDNETKFSLSEVDPESLTADDMNMYEKIGSATSIDEDFIREFNQYREEAGSSTSGSPSRFAFAQWLGNLINEKVDSPAGEKGPNDLP